MPPEYDFLKNLPIKSDDLYGHLINQSLITVGNWKNINQTIGSFILFILIKIFFYKEYDFMGLFDNGKRVLPN
jgi:hypothetical protein